MLALLLAAGPAAGGERDFNGRWDITVPNEPRGRAWWLLVEGAGTPKPSGKFVSAYAGDLNTIDEISISGHIIRFAFRPQERQGGNQGQSRLLVYKAELVQGRLRGTYEVEGQNRPPLEWVGVRAPAIAERDDGSWRDGRPVELFNGRDLDGWTGMVPDKQLGWTVKDGILASAGGANNLISNRKFWNFTAHIEFRLAARSNSGLGLRGRYEVQILDDFGRAPNSHSNGALYSRIAPAVNASRPAGEWQTCDIRLVGMQLTVVLNGTKIIDKGEVEGLTAIASNADEGLPGPFILQGDHGPVDFRRITITPLAQ